MLRLRADVMYIDVIHYVYGCLYVPTHDFITFLIAYTVSKACPPHSYKMIDFYINLLRLMRILTLFFSLSGNHPGEPSFKLDV